MSSYHLTCRWQDLGDVVVLHAAGYLNDQTEAGFEEIAREATRLCQRVVLDARELQHISSIGFGGILALTADLRSAGGDLRFAGLNPSLQRALTLAFGDYFAIEETVTEAVSSFGPGAIAREVSR